MSKRQFKPGFRFNLLDGIILLTGGLGAVYFGIHIWWAGALIALVVLHFFLFCNVFRISRPPELIWAGAFTVLCGSTILTGLPGWTVACLCSLGLATLLIFRETRRPDYHGVCWERWNPNLPEWWLEHVQNKAT